MSEITVQEAAVMAAGFKHLADNAAVRQVRYEMKKRGREWDRAASELEDADGEGAIEVVAAVGPGMMVVGNGQEAWFPIVRVMTRDGQTSLHCEDQDGRPVYRNYFGPSSPIVVKA